MSAPVSVIIPTLNAVESIGPTLAAIYEGVGDGLVCEVILADGGSEDGIELVAEELGAELVVSERGRGTQLADGADHARGEWLLFLHADTVLSHGWSQDMRRHMNRTKSAGYFRLEFDDEGLAPWLVSTWANLRSSLFGLPYGDQGLLVTRVEYNRVGGFQRIPLMEDVDLVRKLTRPRRMLGTATTSAERYRRDGWIRRGTRNLTTLVMWLAGARPEKLAKRYG